MTLTNITGKITFFNTVMFQIQCFYREDCKCALHTFPQGFFYIKTNRQNHTQREDTISAGK